MKLLLTSAGIRTPELAAMLADLVGKPLQTVNVAVINEAAAVEPGDKRWFLDEMHTLSETIGGEMDFVNLLALDRSTVEQRLDFADVIYVVGGATDYLMTVFQQTGFNDLLTRKLLREKVYVGSSAGSMVLGRRITTDAYTQVYRAGERDFGVNEYLALTDFALFPHLDSQLWLRNRTEVIRDVATGFNYPIYAVKDTQAVVLNDARVFLVGGDVTVVKQ